MFISLRNRIRQGFLLGCASGAALLVLVVGQASAAVYPGGGSTFTGSAEGWTGKVSCASITEIVPKLLCSGSAGYSGTVGNPPGSFAGTTEVTLNLLGLLNSEEVATSPTFTAGEGGAGTLRLERQWDPEGLVGLNPSVNYSVYLVDKTTNTKQKAVTESLSGASAYLAKTGAVNLTGGHSYQIELVASIGSAVGLEGLGILGAANFRIDNVSVTGPGSGETPGGGGGGEGGAGGSGGAGGAGGPGGAGGVSAARLESLLTSSLIGPATLSGNKLTVKTMCPASLNATCTLSLEGMLSKHKPATADRKAKVKKGKKKNFALKVKPADRTQVASKKKLLFKETARVGQSRATIYKTLKLVRK